MMHLGKPHNRRSGYTLIELLIVIAIITIILTMTLVSVNYLTNSSRVTDAASQVQSFFAGARDRAIFERDLRGIRLFVDPNNPRAVSSMAYLQPGERWSVGTVDLKRLDTDDDNVADSPEVFIVEGFNLGWWQLKRRGLITEGSVIEIPQNSGQFYEVSTSLIQVDQPPGNLQDPPVPEQLLLRIPYAEPGGGNSSAVTAFQGLTYEIQLPSQLLPQEPSILPEGIVIDLDGSQIPTAWRPDPADAQGQFSPFMDVFFSPRGNIVGTAASSGLIHFYVTSDEDSFFLKELFARSPTTGTAVELQQVEAKIRSLGTPFVPADQLDSTIAPWLPPEFTPNDPYEPLDRRIVTVFAQTGNIVVNEVIGTDANPTPDGIADSPYLLSTSSRGVK